MTGSVVNAGLLGANALSVIASVASGNPFLEYIQNGASVAAVMGIFLWREMKRAERYERLYDDERKKRIDADSLHAKQIWRCCPYFS